MSSEQGCVACEGVRLPVPSGPFRVGCVEVDLPAPTRAGVVPVTVFYPAVEAEDFDKQSGRVAWADDAHARALGALQLGDCVGGCVVGACGAASTGSAHVEAYEGAPPHRPPTDSGWPVAVFSHGLTAWRYASSVVCCEVASRGCVVVAVEHTDGSACVAVSTKGDVVADYDARGGDPAKWSVANCAMRRGQCAHRRLEVLAALDGLEQAMHRIFSALGTTTKAEDAPGAKFARADVDVALLGQSFGGATVASLALRAGSARHRFSHVLLYDPWFEGDPDADAAKTYPLTEADLLAGAWDGDHLEHLVIWRNTVGGLHARADTIIKRLVDQAGKLNTIHVTVHEVDAGHLAQTDVPYVFEHTPLNFLFALLVGSSTGSEAPLVHLERTAAQTAQALQAWLERSTTTATGFSSSAEEPQATHCTKHLMKDLVEDPAPELTPAPQEEAGRDD